MTLGWLRWRAWSLLVARGAVALCVAGVALGDIDLHFARKAWHLATCTSHLLGRRGTSDTGLAPVARLVAVGRRWSPVAPRHFAWQAWHLATWTSHFAWQPWHLRHSAGSGGALGRPWRRCTLRGNRTWRHCLALCVAGAALGDMHVAFAWQAWHFDTGLAPVARLVAVGRPWRRGTLHGRRGTWRRPPALCVAHLCLGFLVFILYLSRPLPPPPPPPPPPLSSHRPWSHTLFRTLSFTHTHTSFTHSFVTHSLSHATLSHTPSFTHNFVTRHLSHTTLSHTIFHTQLYHTQLFTYNLFSFSILHHLLCPSFLPPSRFNFCCSLLE